MHNGRVGVRDVKREKRGADSWDLPQHRLYSHLEMACPLTHYDFQLQTIELAYFRLCLLTQHREPAKRETRGPKP
jgi:hypothetical protein